MLTVSATIIEEGLTDGVREEVQTTWWIVRWGTPGVFSAEIEPRISRREVAESLGRPRERGLDRLLGRSGAGEVRGDGEIRRSTVLNETLCSQRRSIGAGEGSRKLLKSRWSKGCLESIGWWEAPVQLDGPRGGGEGGEECYVGVSESVQVRKRR